MILDGTLEASVQAAALALQQGRLLGLPTETVYGLAADSDNDAAVAQIFAAKGRPANHPLIVHVADAAAITRYAREVPVFAQQLIDAFWPGPLTLILPRLPHAAKASTGGQDSVGLRCPSHPVAHAVLQACQQLDPPVWGVSAPSANKFGRVSPTTAEHVATEFGDELLVLDGGACEVGIESTIVDCTRGVPVLLRPGAITRDDIARACGQRPLSKEELSTNTPRASGTLLAHYAPNAKVRLMDARQLQSALDILGSEGKNIAVYHRSPLKCTAKGITLRAMPQQALATARELFGTLRDFDEIGAQLIWIETPPDTADWEGVRDRLQRAAAAG
ncbi:L-threonylcarbamoyladenylate synthase [Comamonas resistens]|uniref:Threonylcarbamoyl-AMP synthase n=1 Tax=Comamonas resistens TaxID=3046670 RepID=A0ABY8SQN0_9BURK|nr:L-threonylcarbamoyladenylate synthase [Comamonas resistens]MDL5037233.1 L-threonylcarbamoyladenylate synthase [Comamonas resistens]WHS65372.1 L-threonylcarbamoyladenylate synthase [Comamonas resistens]